MQQDINNNWNISSHDIFGPKGPNLIKLDKIHTDLGHNLIVTER